MKLRKPRPLRNSGAAFLLALLLNSCAPVSPYHVGETPHPQSIQTFDIKPMEVIERKGLKVLLRQGAKNLHLSASSGLKLLDADTGDLLIDFPPGHKGQLAAEGGHLRAGGRLLDHAEAELRAMDPGEAVKVMGLSYRGRLILKAAGDSLLLVNEVALDEYLYGVLPSEVSENWPAEALKAQAVAARTYAVFRAQESPSKLYDLDDSTRSQVYLGTSKEGQHSRAAVDSTKSLVLSYQGALAQTFFFANSGGHTADSRTVWGSNLPYLHGVDDPFAEGGEHYHWHVSIDQDALLAALRKAGHPIQDFEAIEVLGHDDSDRVTRLRLSGRGSNLELSGNAFRQALGGDQLRSTNFKWSRRGDSNDFSGYGWGHGVGLSQEGAEAMARKGYSYKQILEFYFPGTRVKRLVD
jgi:stage II sporulation protein D